MAKYLDKNPLTSPLRGKYLVPFFIPYISRRLLDALLGIILFRIDNHKIVPPKKILLVNWAHLGDVVMSTSILDLIKKKIPDCQIGFLSGSWSKSVIDEHILIDRIHYIDHWKHNRSSLSKFKKIITYLIMRYRAIKEIKDYGYDVAINLNYFVPSAIPVLWAANIPVRIAYTSAGYASMITNKYDWKDENKHVTSYFADLLQPLGVSQNNVDSLKYNLSFKNEIGSLLIERNTKYIVIHIGSGSKAKEWSIKNWRELTIKMRRLEYRLLFTGIGSYEQENIDKIIEGLDYCENLCNKLNFREYLKLISNTSLLIGVDSLAGHLAAAYNVPSVLIYSGLANIHQWKPLANNVTIVTEKTVCSPCYLNNGCYDMECIKSINDENVFTTITGVLKK